MGLLKVWLHAANRVTVDRAVRAAFSIKFNLVLVVSLRLRETVNNLA